MIGSLRGLVLAGSAGTGHSAEVLVEVGGVGYRVLTPVGTLGQLGPPGSAVFLHVHTHVREDAIVLYGFLSADERACFEALIGAHGVGPAVGLALLSVHSPGALRRAVATEDAEALMLVPGIGRKTATRLLVELESRLDTGDDADAGLYLVPSAGPGAGPGTGAGAGSSYGSTKAEVRAALAGLGYGLDEIRHALAQLPAEGTIEEQLRSALRELATAR